LLVSSRDDANDRPRLGLVASKKIGVAVVRNRAKRLVREAFRTNPDLFSPGTDLVVIVRRSLEKLKRDDVVAEWRSVAHVIRKRTREAEGDKNRRSDEKVSGS
jgi:ribonuclease P protein component